MATPNPISISGAVEGLVDEAVLRRLVKHVGAVPGPIHGKNGKQYLRQHMNGYNRAAHFNPWVVLVDLDRGVDCAPLLRKLWLPFPAPRICFRVAVREVEAWLFADRERLAHFLSVATSRVPLNPEGVDDPKRVMVEIARRSRRREIREDMVPRPNSSRVVGPAYDSRLIQFTQDAVGGWRPDIATKSSSSLAHCLKCIRWLIKQSTQ